MRTFMLAAALGAALTPALAGAQTAVAIHGQEMRSIKGPPTIDQLRTLVAEVRRLEAINAKLEAELVAGLRNSTIGDERSQVLQDQIESHLNDLFAKKSQVEISCALLRMRDNGASGTLGLDLRDSVHFKHTVGPDGTALTIIFDGTPHIGSVAPGSPADKAGARVGDVWISVNGKPLVGEVRLDELMKPGAVVVSRVERDGKEIELKPMTVEKRPSDYPTELCDGTNQFMLLPPPSADSQKVRMRATPFTVPSFMPSMPGPQLQFFAAPVSSVLHYAGATLQPLNDKWREFGGVQGDGLIVTDVSEGTLADVAGLKQFDVIRQINNEAATSVSVFINVVKTQPRVELTVSRKVGNAIVSRSVTIGGK
jgi:C-terminal processing protease CtpA/Prc